MKTVAGGLGLRGCASVVFQCAVVDGGSPNETHLKIHRLARPFLQSGCVRVTGVSGDGHQVTRLGASEGEESLVLSERGIDALQRRAEGQAAQWQHGDSL